MLRPLRPNSRAQLGAIVLTIVAPALAANAATFGSFSGALAVRAGSNLPKTTSAIIGSVDLFDLSSLNGFSFATTSLVTSRSANQFNFSGSASSSTNTIDPLGLPRATGSVTFQQPFTTTMPQWIQVTATVLSPPDDPEASAAVGLGVTGQPVTLFVGHSAGSPATRSGLFLAGDYTLSGFASTQAAVPPAHAAALSGYLLIASVADFNGDSVVNGADLPTWRLGFGSTTGNFLTGNLDGDNDSDGADFLLWQRQVGAQALAPISAAVPEPNGAIMHAIAAALLATQVGIHCRTCRSAARRAAASPAR